MAWPVFKTATETPSAAPVGSIPTRSRHFALLLGLVLFAAGTAASQTPRPPTAIVPDSNGLIIKGIKPIPSFLMSLAIPGWAQARLDRKLTAGLFVMWEGISVGMTMKTIRELHYLERAEADSTRLADKRKQRQDWLFLWGFNHLFSGLEAFVSSELHAFPTDVRLEAVPGGMAVRASVPIRIR